MRTLVTGGAGFIGSTLVRRLLDEGNEVRIFDNFLTGSRERIRTEADLVEGDLRDLDAVRVACKDIDVVFHQGALRSVPRSVDEPLLAMECNVGGTLNLLIGAEEAGVRRLVFASSSSVYGDGAEGVQREDSLPNPLSPYAVSKLAGEMYCGTWTRLKGLSTVSLRCFNVFGPGQNPESRYAAVFPAFVTALVKGEAPEIHWDGEQSRDFTYVDDVVGANIFAATAGEEVDGQIVNVGGGTPKTVSEVLRSVAEAVGNWIEPTHAPRRPGDVRRTHADITRARDLLGWTPTTSWEEAIARTVRWFRGDEHWA